MVLLLLRLRDHRLKAHILQPVSISKFHLEFVQLEEFDCLDLSNQVLLIKLVLVVLLN